MKAVAIQGLVAKNLMPFMGIQFERAIPFKVGSKTRTFHVIVYQAYNAFGLIGPENNGIGIADDDNRQVLCDQIAKQGTGYFGASQAQFDEAERICGLQWESFKEFVNKQPTLRMPLSA
jgi:hypothetical protein